MSTNQSPPISSPEKARRMPSPMRMAAKTEPVRAATRVAHARFPLIRQSMARSTRPPSRGKPGMRLNRPSSTFTTNSGRAARSRPCHRRRAGQAKDEGDGEARGRPYHGDDELRSWLVRLSLELRHASEDVQRDAGDGNAVVQRSDGVRQLVQQDRGEQEQGRHQSLDPQRADRQIRKRLGKIPDREVPGEEREDEDPARMRAHGNSADPEKRDTAHMVGGPERAPSLRSRGEAVCPAHSRSAVRVASSIAVIIWLVVVLRFFRARLGLRQGPAPDAQSLARLRQIAHGRGDRAIERVRWRAN